MLGLLLIAMVALPFVDLYILVQLAGMIGFWQTLGIVVLTGLAGAEIIRREGRYVLQKLQTSVSAGEVSRNVLEGVLLAVSGLLLISPGLVTDAIGFLLTFRPLRERVVAYLVNSRDFSNVEVRTYSF